MYIQNSRKDLGQMDQTRTRRGLARLLGGVAALTAAAAAGGGEATAAKKRKKRSETGFPGPAGPVGPVGPVGPAGAPVTFVSISGERSSVLADAAGSEVDAVVECGLNSIPVNCGWTYVGNSTELDRTVTEVQAGFLRGVGMCTVRLRRTAAVNSAGGQVLVTATCTR